MLCDALGPHNKSKIFKLVELLRCSSQRKVYLSNCNPLRPYHCLVFSVLPLLISFDTKQVISVLVSHYDQLEPNFSFNDGSACASSYVCIYAWMGDWCVLYCKQLSISAKLANGFEWSVPAWRIWSRCKEKTLFGMLN